MSCVYWFLLGFPNLDLSLDSDGLYYKFQSENEPVFIDFCFDLQTVLNGFYLKFPMDDMLISIGICVDFQTRPKRRPMYVIWNFEQTMSSFLSLFI